MSSERDMTLGEAARRFLTTLPNGEAKSTQQEVNLFVRWFGAECPLAMLSPHEVASYAERLSVSDRDYSRKLEQVKIFLSYARKEGWLKTNLATHLKPKKGRRVQTGRGRGGAEAESLTQGKYDELKTELEKLTVQRDEVIIEIRKAAADKDFRENAPLEAAREQHGHIMGRIMELEETLKSAVIIDEKATAKLVKVTIGDHVVLEDTATGEELRYMIVGAREASPAQGKISNVSPVGRAVVGQEEGKVVEVATPGGKSSYRIKLVERHVSGKAPDTSR